MQPWENAWMRGGKSWLEPRTDGTLAELEQDCLTAFLQILSNQRSHLVQCYDREGFPRTVPR